MMTRDQARDLLSDAVEGTLSAEQKEALDAILAEDDELREEMDALRLVMRGAAAIAANDDDVADAKTPDVLGGVQARLRERSKGRYYRDRFSQGGGAQALSPLLLAPVMAVLLAAAWVVLQQIVIIDAP